MSDKQKDAKSGLTDGSGLAVSRRIAAEKDIRNGKISSLNVQSRLCVSLCG